MRAHLARILGLVLCLAGCARAPEPVPTPTPTSAEAVLRVGTSGDYAPFSRDGRGFDVDVARKLADSLGMRLEFVPFAWPELARDVAANRFDVAMSGVTWRPSRALVGRMSRAVASGGPCVLGAADPRRIGVNRGGILERFARARFADREVQTTDDNAALPELLASGAVDAIVTDSFELAHFRRGTETYACEPARDRKVYWLAPARASELGERVERFLREREAELDQLRATHFGEGAGRSELDHLIDLLARRLAYMPAVAAFKRENGRPIEDLAREAAVLERAIDEAVVHGLDPEGAALLFRVQIELAKAVQRRSPEDAQALPLDAVRAALSLLGDRILESLGRAVPIEPQDLASARWAPLAAWIDPEERQRLSRALTGLHRTESRSPPVSPAKSGISTISELLVGPRRSRITAATVREAVWD